MWKRVHLCVCVYSMLIRITWPADGAHVVPRKHSNLARVHGRALEPAILTAFQHQKHLSFPQLQFILLSRSVGKHCHIAAWKTNKDETFTRHIDGFHGGLSPLWNKSMPFALRSSHHPVHLSSAPLGASSKDSALWPRENLHWRTKQFVGHVSAAAKKKQASAGMFSVWFQCCLRGNINGWVWHACNGRKTGMSGSNSYQVVVCLQGVMRVKGERVKSEGSPSGWTNGTQETVTPRLWPLHLSRSSHSADSQLTDEGEGGRKRGLCERQMRISSLWSEHVH